MSEQIKRLQLKQSYCPITKSTSVNLESNTHSLKRLDGLSNKRPSVTSCLLLDGPPASGVVSKALLVPQQDKSSNAGLAYPFTADFFARCSL